MNEKSSGSPRAGRRLGCRLLVDPSQRYISGHDPLRQRWYPVSRNSGGRVGRGWVSLAARRSVFVQKENALVARTSLTRSQNGNTVPRTIPVPASFSRSYKSRVAQTTFRYCPDNPVSALLFPAKHSKHPSQIQSSEISTLNPRSSLRNRFSRSVLMASPSRPSIDSACLSPILSPATSVTDLTAPYPPTRSPSGRPGAGRRTSTASSVVSLTSSLGTALDWRASKDFGNGGGGVGTGSLGGGPNSNGGSFMVPEKLHLRRPCCSWATRITG